MLTFTLLFVLPALIMADPPAYLEQEAFNGLDKDGDSKISTAEAEEYFLGYDENKDGFISQFEFKDNVDKVHLAVLGHENTLFDLLDHNSDGQVTKGDLDAVFKLVDNDGDNVIERQEFSLAFAVVLKELGLTASFK